MRTLRPGLSLLPTFALLFLFAAANARAQLPAPKPGVTLSPAEKELLDEINFVRTRPAEYAKLLESLKASFKGNTYQTQDGRVMTTQEGWKAVEEAIQALRASKPLQPLKVSYGMCSGAGELARDQRKSGLTGHRGSDGSFCEDRVTRFGDWASPIGENLSYGNHSARERLFNFLIDDGVSNRNHRKRLLDPAFKVAGISCGEHTSEGSVCVVTLAGGFTEKLKTTQPSAPGAKSKANSKGKSSTPTLPSGAQKY